VRMLLSPENRSRMQHSEEEEVMFITQDISEVRDMEEQSRQAENRSTTATSDAQVHRDFLAFTGHECRNPLNALFNISDFLANTGLSEQQSQYVGIMQSSCDDMLRILNDLLDLSKIEAGQIETEALPVNVRETVDIAVASTRLRATRKGVTVASEVLPAVPDTLSGDISRVKQILVTLISHAIAQTENGKVVVKVSVHNDLRAKELFVKFKITDGGIWEDQEAVAKLFAVDGQIGIADYQAFHAGSGIGLRLSALLVQQSMGGSIGIKSGGKGTTMWFTLPFSFFRKPKGSRT